MAHSRFAQALAIGMLAASIPLLAACSGILTGTTALQGSWVLESGSDAEGSFIEPVQPITLVFEGDALSGQAPCNPYSGTVQRGPGAGGTGPIELPGVSRTEMGCAEQEQNLLESRYFAALENADRVAIEGDLLELTGEGIYLLFERAAS
ncbi:MAG: META domain-containing protein [Microcella sp.]|nr:META domain-containing protein [Microcella sp.]